jgi:hypothetical protein
VCLNVTRTRSIHVCNMSAYAVNFRVRVSSLNYGGEGVERNGLDFTDFSHCLTH